MKKLAAIASVAVLLITNTAMTSAFAGAINSPPPVSAATAPVREMSKDQAVEMARQAYPGEVTRVYLDRKMGRKTWAVLINGRDGRKWAVHYEIATGALVVAEGR